jgi:hypothetical protein
MQQLALQELLRVKEHLVGGQMTRWFHFHPTLPPLVAKIVDIEDIRHDGTDYRDIIVRTEEFVSTIPGGPVFALKDFEFEANPPGACICHACSGLWVVAVPLKGLVHLQYRTQ